MFRKLRARIALGVVSLAVSLNAQSAFHLWKINEIYSNADGTVQFIEFTTTFGNQQFVSGQTVTTQGTSTQTFTFPGNLPGDSANKKFLMGTAAVAAAGGVTPDFIIPNGFLSLTNGTINFAGFDIVSYTSLPLGGTLSIDRLGASAANSPTNFAGVQGMVVIANPTPPGPPIIGLATPGNGQATIAFTPGTAGSSPTTGFTATCTSTGQTTRTGTNTVSPITVTSLTNGATYSCTVTATNTNGTSGASGAVNVTPVVPITVPGAPTINTVTPGVGQATVDFSPPANDGGAALDYIATCSGMQAAGLSSPITVFGLANATTHLCTVVAHNSAGNGPASTPFLVTLPSAPDAPVVGTITPGNTSATIAFTPPANNGGSAIIDFSATCNPGAITRVNMVSPIVYAPGSLANGTVYTCSLTAPGMRSVPARPRQRFNSRRPPCRARRSSPA